MTPHELRMFSSAAGTTGVVTTGIGLAVGIAWAGATYGFGWGVAATIAAGLFSLLVSFGARWKAAKIDELERLQAEFRSKL